MTSISYDFSLWDHIVYGLQFGYQQQTQQLLITINSILFTDKIYKPKRIKNATVLQLYEKIFFINWGTNYDWFKLYCKEQWLSNYFIFFV